MHGSTGFVRTIGALLLLGGIVIFGLTAVMNYLQGDIWAVTESGKLVNRWSAVIIDAVGIVVIGFAAGSAFAVGKRGWGLGLTFVMFLSAVASINSMASFQATERMSASKTREAANDRIKDADKLQATSAANALRLAAGADSKSARKDFIGANRDAIKDFRSAPVSVQVAPDAGAELWASFSGWTVSKIQMVQAAYLAILLIILKMVCFQAAGFFLNPLAWLQSTSLSSSKKGGSGEGGESVKSSEESKDKPASDAANVVPIRAASDQLQTPPKVSADQPRVPAPAPRSVPLTLQSTTAYASVEDFLARHPSVTNQKVIADAMGVSQAKVSRDIKRLKGRGKVKVEKTWRSNAIAYTPRRNGGVLHAVI